MKSFLKKNKDPNLRAGEKMKNETEIRAKIKELMYASSELGEKLHMSAKTYNTALRKVVTLEKELLTMLGGDEQ